MARSAQLDNTNAITRIFCLLRGSVQGRSAESSRRAAQTQPLLRVTAKPGLASLATSLSAEKRHTGLQQRGSEIKATSDGSSLDETELSWLWILEFCGPRIHL